MVGAATERAVTYRVGLCMASVCAPKSMPIEEVEAQVNADNPTGLDFPWRLCDDATFSGGQPNPCPCDQSPNRIHWLLNC
jgi:hypothetical protein